MSDYELTRDHVWTARYALRAASVEDATAQITAQALKDVPEASVEIIRGPIRDKGPRPYYRATVRRVRS